MPMSKPPYAAEFRRQRVELALAGPDRGPSRRARANAELMQRIAEVHRASDATYGMPRVHAELAAQLWRLAATALRGSCER